jgi:type II secretion system protein N
MTVNRELMKRVGIVVGALVWALLVFQAALWLTFPSDAMSRWLVYQVSQRMPGYHIEMGSVRPWGTGVTVREVKLFTAPSTRSTSTGEAEVPTLVALADRVRGRLSPWALLSGGYDVRGDVRLVEGKATYRVGVRPDERGRMLLTDFNVESSDLPVAELLPLLPLSEPPTGSGLLNIEINVEAGDEGLGQATGRISITGSNLVISDLATESTGPIGMDIPIQELKIEAPIEGGKASIVQGLAHGELATLEIKGDLLLRDPLSRSTLNLELLVSNLGPALQPMAGFLGTPHSDGKYHYQIRGLASRPSVFAARESITSAAGRVSSGASSLDRSSPGYVSPTTSAETAEERERRIAEAQERLRQRREQRDAATGDVLSTRGRPPVETDPEEVLEDDEEEPDFGNEADDELGGPLEIPLPVDDEDPPPGLEQEEFILE